MEHRAKKLAILAVGIVAVGLGCQPAWLSRGGTAPIADEKPVAREETADQKALAATQSQQLLDKVAAFLGEDPIDGRFGIGRVPTLHGKTTYGSDLEKDASSVWHQVIAKDYAMIYTVGRGKTEQVEANKYVPRTRSYLYSYQRPNRDEWNKLPADQRVEALKKRRLDNDRMMAEMQTAAKDLMKSGSLRSSAPIMFEGHKSTLDLLAVYPTSKKCLSCHTGVPENEPIGVVSLIRTPKM